MTLIPQITSTPGNQLTYNPGMAETFSWIPIEGAGRPLFAKATYAVNSPSQGGFVYQNGAGTIYGNFNSIKMVATTTITAITASNSVTTGINAVAFPANFVLEGPIQGVTISGGTIVAQRI